MITVAVKILVTSIVMTTAILKVISLKHVADTAVNIPSAIARRRKKYKE